jgi:hypothetical protein
MGRFVLLAWTFDRYSFFSRLATHQSHEASYFQNETTKIQNKQSEHYTASTTMPIALSLSLSLSFSLLLGHAAYRYIIVVSPATCLLNGFSDGLPQEVR